MTKHAYRRDIVDVAIAVVVDKLSDQNQQPRDFQDDSMEPRRDRSQLHVLISRRKKEQVLGGYWELPGGKVEPSETPTHAVVRELREEVGIEATPIETLSVVEHEYDHAHVRLHPFICQHTAGTPSAIEVDEVRWVTPSSLAKYRFPEASEPILASFLNWLDVHQNAAPTSPTN